MTQILKTQNKPYRIFFSDWLKKKKNYILTNTCRGGWRRRWRTTRQTNERTKKTDCKLHSARLVIVDTHDDAMYEQTQDFEIERHTTQQQEKPSTKMNDRLLNAKKKKHKKEEKKYVFFFRLKTKFCTVCFGYLVSCWFFLAFQVSGLFVRLFWEFLLIGCFLWQVNSLYWRHR